MADLILPDASFRPDCPVPIDGLVTDAADILRVFAADLPLPASVDVHQHCQHINFQFDPDPASYATLAAWAEAFGGSIISEPWTTETGQPVTVCLVHFDYLGIAVEAFAVIPADPAST